MLLQASRTVMINEVAAVLANASVPAETVMNLRAEEPSVTLNKEVSDVADAAVAEHAGFPQQPPTAPLAPVNSPGNRFDIPAQCKLQVIWVDHLKTILSKACANSFRRVLNRMSSHCPFSYIHCLARHHKPVFSNQIWHSNADLQLKRLMCCCTATLHAVRSPIKLSMHFV